MTTRTADLVTISETVSLPIPVAEAIRQWEEYQELTRLLLNETDYQDIGDRQLKKKSAWRKYARAFNISDHVTYEHIERRPDGFPLWARIRVEAVASNGRIAEADHECHISERCCPSAKSQLCSKTHAHCAAGCDGTIHWSHPGDLPATALTRAKNRAISDLIGAGEVSAEEMAEQKEVVGPTSRGGKDKAPHWCAEHDIAYFKSGKMSRYAHPIGDTGKWCNEEPAKPSEAKPTSPATPNTGVLRGSGASVDVPFGPPEDAVTDFSGEKSGGQPDPVQPADARPRLIPADFLASSPLEQEKLISDEMVRIGRPAFHRIKAELRLTRATSALTPDEKLALALAVVAAPDAGKGE